MESISFDASTVQTVGRTRTNGDGIYF